MIRPAVQKRGAGAGNQGIVKKRSRALPSGMRPAASLLLEAG
jgi:hypothetical protein